MWQANLVTRVYGYMARVCGQEKSHSKNPDGKNRNILDPETGEDHGIKLADGTYLRGMRDFSFNVYGTPHFECSEKCDPVNAQLPDVENPGVHFWQ
jgi:hypothetical protein